MLGVILFNLIDNAVKYTQQGTIKIECLQHALEWQLIVSDSGRGINTEILNKIQNIEVTKLSKIKSVDDQGYGIGWSIISDCLQILNARVVIDSKENVGTSFKLIFPNQSDN